MFFLPPKLLCAPKKLFHNLFLYSSYLAVTLGQTNRGFLDHDFLVENENSPSWTFSVVERVVLRPQTSYKHFCVCALISSVLQCPSVVLPVWACDWLQVCLINWVTMWVYIVQGADWSSLQTSSLKFGSFQFLWALLSPLQPGYQRFNFSVFE